MTLEAEEIVKSNHLLRGAWEHGPAWVSSYQTLVAEKRLRLLSNATRRPTLNCYDIFQHPSTRHALAPPRTSCSIIRSGHIPILPFGLDCVSTPSNCTRLLLGRKRPNVILIEVAIRAAGPEEAEDFLSFIATLRSSTRVRLSIFSLSVPPLICTRPYNRPCRLNPLLLSLSYMRSNVS